MVHGIDEFYQNLNFNANEKKSCLCVLNILNFYYNKYEKTSLITFLSFFDRVTNYLSTIIKGYFLLIIIKKKISENIT